MSVYTLKTDKYSSHMKIVNYLKNKEAKGLTILDVGCSKGFIGQTLSGQNKLYGIEANKKDASSAKIFYKDIKICDLDMKMPNFTKKFDIIIMADVIEHLKNPFEVVLGLKKSLKKDGIIIISVPNIANVYVRLKLLFGNFDYEEKGILDKTHLKFFTLKSIRKFISKLNLKIINEEVTPIPLPTINPIFSQNRLLSPLHKTNYIITLLWKRMFGFQFIVYCKKRS